MVLCDQFSLDMRHHYSIHALVQIRFAHPVLLQWLMSFFLLLPTLFKQRQASILTTCSEFVFGCTWLYLFGSSGLKHWTKSTYFWELSSHNMYESKGLQNSPFKCTCLPNLNISQCQSHYSSVAFCILSIDYLLYLKLLWLH